MDSSPLPPLTPAVHQRRRRIHSFPGTEEPPYRPDADPGGLSLTNLWCQHVEVAGAVSSADEFALIPG